ncbi:hypothetical protein SS50377_28576 [Spironucleus salmonicida]|uniref:Uncharacterized protein n=1 Tax=Spironucleus salmonicida TaxID=348837 RepID=A0A9P8LK35_9EUKA|nr:hypothetical protein SS50377_28576 [Spironucleus salmonicida]
MIQSKLRASFTYTEEGETSLELLQQIEKVTVCVHQLLVRLDGVAAQMLRNDASAALVEQNFRVLKRALRRQ